MVESSQGRSSQPGSSRSHSKGDRRNGWHTCRAHSVCRSGQADRISGRKGLGIRVHRRSCHSWGCRCPRSCRHKRCCSWLPRSPQGRAGGSGYLSTQPGTGSVREQDRSRQHGHSHSDWHSLHQTAPSGRGAGSWSHATQGYRYRLQSGDCRLPHGHTGSWHCNRSPKFQAGRAQSSYHAANLPCRRRCHRWASRQWHFRRSSVASS